ncbi:MAG TPA: DUF3426 domain-containing protein [Gammaproteobacteria bacterium]|nr:DUF3426 domain-containing protein [Gammaproteobacteria bacterium]
MHTTCPECSSVFRVTPEQLNMAHGKVRCGYCQHVFDALKFLEEDWQDQQDEGAEPPEETRQEHHIVVTDATPEFGGEPVEQSGPPKVYQDDEELPLDEILSQPDPDPGPGQDEKHETSALSELAREGKPSVLPSLTVVGPEEDLSATSPGPAQDEPDTGKDTILENLFDDLAEPTPETVEDSWPDPETAEQPGPAPEQNIDMAHSSPAGNELPDESMFDDAPGILREELAAVTGRQTGSNTRLWSTGIILLTLTLLLQGMYSFRNSLAQNEQMRGIIIGMCVLLKCEIPLRNDASRGIKTIKMLNHAILSVPQEPDQLRIKTIFTNTATYAQVYPVLSIKLSDESGDVTAMRRFLPNEYLAKHINIKEGLPAKTAVEVFVDVIKPKHPVVSYQFDFL